MERWGKRIAAALLLCLAAVLVCGAMQMRRDVAALPAGEDSGLSAAERFLAARDKLRAAEKAQLSDVAHDARTDPALSEMAKRQLVELCAREEQETTLEGILELRGWSAPVVTVHKDSVNVLLQCEGTGGVITEGESAAILELVCRETGVDRSNVKIMPVE